jgi:hypothetical protein
MWKGPLICIINKNIHDMRGRIVKCAIHPQNEAIGVCTSCGRYICDACRVNVLNNPHCKGCAETIIRQMVGIRGRPKPVKIPQPRGPPSSKYYLFGIIGSIMMAVGAMLLWILGMNRNYGFLSWNLWELFWNVGVPILCIGIAITSIGFYGFYINFGSTMGYICLMILPLSALFFVSIFFYSFHITFEIGRFSTGVASMSIGLILMAITILSVEKFTMTRVLSKATAIFLFAAAALSWVVFVTEAIGIGWMILFVASILLALFFHRINLPLMNLREISSPHPLVRTTGPVKPITLKYER